MIRIRVVVGMSAMVLALCLSARAQNESGQVAGPKKDSAAKVVQAKDIERQIEELRQMVLQQSQQIAAQQTTIREEQDKMEELAAEVAAGKATNPVTIQPAVYSANSSLASRVLEPAPAPQVRQAAGYTPPDNTPKIGVGATMFPNFTLQEHPTVTDSDGNFVRKNAFDVSRAYLNITGNISHIVAFRITPDISRETNTASALFGSLVFRIKYAFLQTNLDDWMTKGSWARFGIQQTPYVDFMEGIYRYRFQGTILAERAAPIAYLSSSDAGASFHYNFPSNYGDLHVGVYNGETYNKAEVNNQKAIMVRATLRPLPTGAPVLRGFRATIFYDGDNYLQNSERKRLFTNVTFEHKYLVAAFEYLEAHDQTSAKPGTPNVVGRGYSIWATPRAKKGWEGLLRYDHLTPNTSSAFVTGATAPNATTTFDSQKQNRMILGIAYWFPHEGSVTSALLFDYDAQIFRNISTTQPVRVFAIHGLINY